MGKLTNQFIRSVKGNGKDQFLSDGSGLYLRVTPAGTRCWIYRYRNRNKQTQWLRLGYYPTKPLSQARAEAAVLKQRRLEGIDPVSQLKKQLWMIVPSVSLIPGIPRTDVTVKTLFHQWEKQVTSKRKDKGESVRRMFMKDVLPFIGEMPVSGISKRDIAQLINPVLERNDTGRMASQVLATVRQFFCYAIDQDLIEIDPSASIRKSRLYKPVERERVLDNAEIVLLLKERLPTSGIPSPNQKALFLILATACRIGELLKAKTSDIHLEKDKRYWRIPEENSKNGKEHIVFLSDFALSAFKDLIAAQKKSGKDISIWLFPSRTGKTHIDEKTIAKQVNDRQRPEQDPIQGRTQQNTALLLPNGKWTLHDLRRTAATMMGNLGVRPEVIERCLNHTEQNRMMRIYQRQQYHTEMKEAWKKLDQFLQKIS